MNTNSGNEEYLEERDFELKSFLLKYLGYWYYFLIIGALSFTIAYYYNWYTTPVYGVSSKLMIKSGNTPETDILEELNMSKTQKNIENEIEILESHTLIEKTIRSLDFQPVYTLLGKIKTSELYRLSPFKIRFDTLRYEALHNELMVHVNSENGGTIGISNKDETLGNIPFQFEKQIDLPIGSFVLEKSDAFKLFDFNNPDYEKRDFSIRFNSFQNLVSYYQTNLQIDLARNQSTILQLSLTDPIPAKGADFLNKLMEVYLDNDIEIKNETTSITSRFISERLDLIAEELDLVESNLENYKTSNGIVDLSSESKLLLESMQNLDEKFSINETKIAMINNLSRYVEADNQFSDAELAPSAMGIDEPLLTKLINELMELEKNRGEMISSVEEGNIILSPIDQKILATKESLKENLTNIQESLAEQNYTYQKQLSRYNNKISALPKIEREFMSIDRQFRLKEKLYTYLLEKQAEVSISLASSVSDNRIIDKAIISPGPIKPIKKRAYTLALLATLFLPIVLIFFKEKLNDSVQDKATIEKICKTPIIGVVGFNKNLTNLVVVERPKSAISEAFRNIRTNLRYFTAEMHQKVILVTSSIGSEGKTFTAINLAGIMSMSGLKTVLIGMDLRKPKIIGDFKLSNDVGVSNFLIGQADFSDVVQYSGIPNLDIITSGPIPPNPAELIMNKKMEKFMQLLRENYDQIIIDSPPIGLVTDGFLLAKHADASIFVIRQNATKKIHLKQIEEIAQKKKLPNLSLLFNAVKIPFNFYNYGYGYSYEYGQGYYSDEQEPTNTVLKKTKDLFPVKDVVQN